MDDLTDFHDSSLALPIDGKTYRVPSPPARIGLECQRASVIIHREQIGGDVSDDDAAFVQSLFGRGDFHEVVLGPAFHEMVADDVPWTMVKHASATAYIWITAGRKAADARWAHGGGAQGEAPAVKAPQDRKPKKK